MLISRTLLTALTAMMGASVLMTGSAKAADTVTAQPQDEKPKRERFDCDFLVPKDGSCRAELIIREKKDDEPRSSSRDDDHERRARLRIICNGVVVYSDSADVDRRDDVIVAKGFPAPPVLVIRKDRDDEHHDHDRDLDAVLVLGGDIRLRGTCDRDRDDEDHISSISTADVDDIGNIPFPRVNGGKGNPFPFPIPLR